MQFPEMKKVAPGEVIYRAGDSANTIYFITGGNAVVHIKNRTIDVGVGMVLGDASLAEGVYKATVEAGSSGCNLMMLPATQFEDQIKQSPPLVRAFVEAMISRSKIIFDEIL